MTDLADRVTRGETRAIARMLRIVDDDRKGAIPHLRALYSHTGRAHIVGITGNPGAGKSSLVDRLIGEYREAGKRVAVVAVDPTSPFTGGAILGDRIRMQRHFLDEGVFIRSVATRGQLGGISRSTAESVLVLDAAGFDVVIIETVGVGQDELEVTRHAHTTLVIVAPGLGDDIQAIKAGILEIADIFVLNKADRDGADATVRDLEQMMMLAPDKSHAVKSHGHSAAMAHRRGEEEHADVWQIPVMRTIATRGEGVAELAKATLKHREYLASSPAGKVVLRRKTSERVRERIRDELLDALVERLGTAIDERVLAIVEGHADPFGAAEDLMQQAMGAESSLAVQGPK